MAPALIPSLEYDGAVPVASDLALRVPPIVTTDPPIERPTYPVLGAPAPAPAPCAGCVKAAAGAGGFLGSIRAAASSSSGSSSSSGGSGFLGSVRAAASSASSSSSSSGDVVRRTLALFGRRGGFQTAGGAVRRAQLPSLSASRRPLPPAQPAQLTAPGQVLERRPALKRAAPASSSGALVLVADAPASAGADPAVTAARTRRRSSRGLVLVLGLVALVLLVR